MTNIESPLDRFGRTFPSGHILFHDGDAGNEMYVIQTGKVRVSKNVRGTEKILSVFGPGDFFGEMSILNNKPRSATATVLEDTKLLVIDPKTFESMVRGNTEIAVRMIKKLAQRLQEADQQIENLLLKDHQSRVVHYLTHLANKEGQQSAEGWVVKATEQEIAAATSLEPEQVSQVFERLQRVKLLQQRGGVWVMADTDKLRDFLDFLAMKERFGEA